MVSSLNDVEVKAVLGRGSFGCVRLATIKQTKTRCAIKQMHKSVSCFCCCP